MEVHPAADTQNRAGIAWRYLLPSLLILLLMPSDRSLWIDEGVMAWFAGHGSFYSLWRDIAGAHGSDAQLPLAIIWFWAITKMVGTGEIAMRATNLLWLGVGCFCLAKAGRRLGVSWLPLFFVVQPFVWFYADEIRPYAMQLEEGCLLVLGLTNYLVDGELTARNLVLLLVAGWILCATSMLGLISFGSAMLVLVVLQIGRRQIPGSRIWLILSVGTVIFLPLGLYYAWTLRQGSGGAKVWTLGIANPALILYDFFGFNGFGPGREELRVLAKAGGIAGAIQGLTRYILPIGVLSASYLLCLVSIARSLRDRSRRQMLIPFVAVPFIALVALFFAAVVVKFPFWSRHLAAAFPFVVTTLGVLLHDTYRRSRKWGQFLFCLIFTLLLISSFELRFARRHDKDDYRSATATALTALQQGQSVLWAADDATGDYYGLEKANRGNLIRLVNPSSGELPWAAPDWIILSKSDLYDSQGAIRKYVSDRGYRLESTPLTFSIYRRNAIL